MTLQPIDVAAFAGFLLLVVGVSLYASRGSKSAAGYFLAGRNLPWWLIGFSLIASNISTEHFVGMAGRGYDLGLAIASYEWMAAVTLVLVGLFFPPRFLAAGIYTIPEYLEFRYDVRTRTLRLPGHPCPLKPLLRRLPDRRAGLHPPPPRIVPHEAMSLPLGSLFLLSREGTSPCLLHTSWAYSIRPRRSTER
ncbi:sodium:solute symporter family transporter [Candidatus Palauibacter sp.]|uniref:sodium:solute symporter family transporter n=1 Tax=Candidatus Palauibacter sp. TaxID=3101350 RepID=UPI003B01825B